MNGLKRVVCLMNGNVDSSVAAYLLKQKGYNVVGVTVYNKFLSREQNERRLERSENIAKDILQIPWKTYSPSETEINAFERAIERDLKSGFEPHLDVLYHKFVTYGCAFEHALHQHDADLFATAHYVRTDAEESDDRLTPMKSVRLYRALDLQHDDSYNLCQVVQKTLQRCIFPLGSFPREVVLKIAERAKIPLYQKMDAPDSHGVFGFSSLLPSSTKDFERIEGKFINITNREELGSHKGMDRYGIGKQYKVGSSYYYIVEKDPKTGNIYLAKDVEHPSAYRDTLFTTMANWTHNIPYRFYHQKQMMDTSFKMGQNHPINKCTLTVGMMTEWCGNDHLILSSSTPMHMVVPGHFCAFYNGEECIGSGQIKRVGPSHFAMNYDKYRHLKDETNQNSSPSFINLKKFFDRFRM